MKAIITFDSSAKAELLDWFGASVDSEGFLVEKGKPGERVVTQEGNPVDFRLFGGVRKGSLIFFETDLPSILDLADRLKG